MSRDEKNEKLFDLDEVLEEIKFGKFQVIIFILIAFPIFLNGISSSAYIFTAGTLNYRCLVPECEGLTDDNQFLNDWVKNAVPMTSSNYPEKCEKYALNDDKCSESSFNRSEILHCDDFVYEDDEVTILNQFKLNCDDEFYLSLIGTINNIGQLFCYLLTGFLSDRYGRKFVLIMGTFGSGVFGLLRIFAANYTQFAIFEFFDQFLGAATYSTSFIIGLELVVPKYRTNFGTLLNCFYAFGEIYLGLIASVFRNYKTILLITYSPAVLSLFYICILPQSIRWLFQQGHNNEAKKILLKASKINKNPLSESTLAKLNEGIRLREDYEEISSQDKKSQKLSVRAILTIANISFLWFATIFVYYGLNINAVYLEYWDKYWSFIVVCLIELPSYFITNYMMEKFGRKKTLFVGMIGSGIFCVLSEFVVGDLFKTVTFVIGKMLITISFSCLYIFTIEVFPTNLRHRFFSLCSVVGRIGSILTPLTPLLAQKVWMRLPLIIFSGLSLASAFLLSSLPETKDKKLPETVDEAFNN